MDKCPECGRRNTPFKQLTPRQQDAAIAKHERELQEWKRIIKDRPKADRKAARSN